MRTPSAALLAMMLTAFPPVAAVIRSCVAAGNAPAADDTCAKSPATCAFHAAGIPMPTSCSSAGVSSSARGSRASARWRSSCSIVPSWSDMLEHVAGVVRLEHLDDVEQCLPLELGDQRE